MPAGPPPAMTQRVCSFSTTDYTDSTDNLPTHDVILSEESRIRSEVERHAGKNSQRCFASLNMTSYAKTIRILKRLFFPSESSVQSVVTAMKPNQPLFLGEEQVRPHLRMADLIPTMENALIDFSSEKVTQPVRSVIKVDPYGGFFGLMPALTPNGLGLKAVTFYPANAEHGIPTHMATIFLVDPQTGTPLAIMDGRLITEMRTAAVSAAATKLLASPTAKVLAVLGSGVQARSHVEALRIVRAFEEIRVWSHTLENAKRFANEIGGTAMSAEEAVRGADVIVTVTSSKTPVLKGEWLKAGSHVNAVGACRPDWRELDDTAMQTGILFVDSREGAVKESGDVLLSHAKIYAELGEALAGKVLPRANETTIFKSLGMAVEDIAAAMLVYRSTTQSGLKSPEA